MSNHSASLAIQQAFSKSCLVNLISKDTRLVLSLYLVEGMSTINQRAHSALDFGNVSHQLNSTVIIFNPDI